MNSTKISIVTAVYNRSETVGDTIRSVLAQSYCNIEHVIQDGGSSDGTLDVVRQLTAESHRIASSVSIASERDGGIYDAINRGIARASGDVIGLLHSDDFLACDEAIEKIAAVFEDPAIDGVYSDLQYVSADDPQKVVRHWRSGAFKPSKIARGWMPPHPTLYLRREVFECWGLYDASLRIAADYDAMLRYIVKGRIRLAYIPEVLVRMRVGGESNRSLGRIMRKSREDYQAIRRHEIGGLGTLLSKNFSKIPQFICRR